MKKILSLILMSLLILSLSSCTSKDSRNASSVMPDSAGAASEKGALPDDLAQNQYPEHGFFAGVEITLKDIFPCTDFSGQRAVYTTLDFTNHSGETISFSSAIQVYATQNDSLLPPATVHNVPEYDVTNQIKYIASGETIEVQTAFQLNGDEAPVTVYIAEFMSENGPVLSKQFPVPQ